MKLLPAGVLSAALAAGLVGSVAAYRSQAPENLEQPPLATVQAVGTVDRAPQGIRLRWAPCPEGTRLDKKACVKHVVRTVVLPAVSLPPPAPAVAAASGTAHTDHDDDTVRDSDPGDDDHHGDDPGDDEPGDDEPRDDGLDDETDDGHDDETADSHDSEAEGD